MTIKTSIYVHVIGVFILIKSQNESHLCWFWLRSDKPANQQLKSSLTQNSITRLECSDCCKLQLLQHRESWKIYFHFQFFTITFPSTFALLHDRIPKTVRVRPSNVCCGALFLFFVGDLSETINFNCLKWKLNLIWCTATGDCRYFFGISHEP